MSKLTPNQLQDLMNELVNDLESKKNSYLKNPTDHSRKRKISFTDVIHATLQMSGGSLNHELLNYYDCDKEKE